jgi:hypothetical protein
MNYNNYWKRRRQMSYQYDGDPAQFARQVKQHLDEMFPGRWIARDGPITLVVGLHSTRLLFIGLVEK